MIVGDPERFAVEFELDVTRMSEPDFWRWQWGRIRWWCGGESVGIFDPQVQLIYTVVRMRQLVDHPSNREGESLIREPVEVIFQTVIPALYEGCDEQSWDEIRENKARYDGIMVGPEAFEFDPWRLMLVGDGSRGRFLWSSRDHFEDAGLVPGVPLREVELRAGEFHAVQRLFLNEVAGIETEFRSREGR